MYSPSVLLALATLLQWSDSACAIPTSSSRTSFAGQRRRLPYQTAHEPSVIPDLQTRQNNQVQASNVKVVYRGDQRSPEELMALGGFPTEFEGPTTNASYSLQVHHNGRGLVRSAYASTSRSFATAIGFATVVDGIGVRAPGWIYEIQPTPNMIDMDNSGFSPLYGEEEYSAMGGVRWDQVKSFMYCPLNLTGGPYTPEAVKDYHDASTFFKKFPQYAFTPNTQYKTAYNQYRPSPGQPQLAGNATTEENDGLYQGKTLEQWALEFMNKNGAPVGWKGSFPLDLKAPASS